MQLCLAYLFIHLYLHSGGHLPCDDLDDSLFSHLVQHLLALFLDVGSENLLELLEARFLTLLPLAEPLTCLLKLRTGMKRLENTWE